MGLGVCIFNSSSFTFDAVADAEFRQRRAGNQTASVAPQELPAFEEMCQRAGRALPARADSAECRSLSSALNKLQVSSERVFCARAYRAPLRDGFLW